MIRFNCPGCDRPFKVADEHAGKSIRCPACKSVIRVPAGGLDEEPAPALPRPSRAVDSAEDSPPHRKARLEMQDDDGPRRRDDLEDRRPRRRRDDEEDEGDRPRRRKNKKKPEASTDTKLFIALSLGLSALYVILGVLGFLFKGGAIVMLVIGAVPVCVGTWWILDVARKEGDFEYFACKYVPFYDTWFTISRWDQTWGACLLCWIGRAFAITAGILLLLHFLHEKGGGWPRHAASSPAAVDAECAGLLKSPDAAEARGWLAAPGRRVEMVTVGRVTVRAAVEGLYQSGATRVTFADMLLDEDGDDPMHVVIELAGDKEKRQAVLNYVNAHLQEPDDPRVSDRGQKYLLVLTN